MPTCCAALVHSFRCEGNKRRIPLIGPCALCNNVLCTVLLCWYKQRSGGESVASYALKKNAQLKEKLLITRLYPPVAPLFFCRSSVSQKLCCTGEGSSGKARKSHALAKQPRSGETVDFFVCCSRKQERVVQGWKFQRQTLKQQLLWSTTLTKAPPTETLSVLNNREQFFGFILTPTSG